MLFVLHKINDLSMKGKRSCGSVAFHKHRNQQTKLLEKRSSHSFLVCVDLTLLAAPLSLGPLFFLPVLEAFSRANGLFPLRRLTLQSELGAEGEEHLSERCF